MQGTIKNLGRSYGFIVDGSTGKDVFFHCNNLPYRIDKLGDGDLVEFRIVETYKGKHEAVDVKLIKKSVPTHPTHWRAP